MVAIFCWRLCAVFSPSADIEKQPPIVKHSRPSMTFSHKGKTFLWREEGHLRSEFSLALNAGNPSASPEVKELTSFHLTRFAPYDDEAVRAR